MPPELHALAGALAELVTLGAIVAGMIALGRLEARHRARRRWSR